MAAAKGFPWESPMHSVLRRHKSYRPHTSREKVIAITMRIDSLEGTCLLFPGCVAASPHCWMPWNCLHRAHMQYLNTWLVSTQILALCMIIVMLVRIY